MSILQTYLLKMKGGGPLQPSLSAGTIFWSWPGALIMFIIALIVNNLAPGRNYPIRWL